MNLIKGRVQQEYPFSNRKSLNQHTETPVAQIETQAATGYKSTLS